MSEITIKVIHNTKKLPFDSVLGLIKELRDNTLYDTDIKSINIEEFGGINDRFVSEVTIGCYDGTCCLKTLTALNNEPSDNE